MELQKNSTISADILRALPYPILLNAVISFLMLLSIINVVLHTNGGGHASDIYINYELIGILHTLGYALAVYCLSSLAELSGKLRTAQILTIAAVILCCINMLMRGNRIYQDALGNTKAVALLEAVNRLLNMTEDIMTAFIILLVGLGIKEAVFKVCKKQAASQDTGAQRGRPERPAVLFVRLGIAYIAVRVLLDVGILFFGRIDPAMSEHFLVVAISTTLLLELGMFFSIRRSAAFLWRTYGFVKTDPFAQNNW